MIYQKHTSGLLVPKMFWTGQRAGFVRYKLIEREAVPTVTVSMEMCRTKQEAVSVLCILGDMLGVPVKYTFAHERDDGQDTISLELTSASEIRRRMV